MLNAVVCVVDARNLLAQLADPRRSQIARQIELACTIALGTTDVAGPGRTIAVREQIARAQPTR